MPKKPKVEDLQIQISELTEALQRERADAINVRRRYEEQNKSLKDIVKADVVREILPVLDNLSRISSHRPEGLKDDTNPHFDMPGVWDWINGIELAGQEAKKIMHELGLSKIKTVGEPFNPELHEAVSAEGDGGEETVSEELQPGYILGDQVIRHAMVKVKNI